MTDEQVEVFAVRAALGNNGGYWNTHYTEKHKEYWRRFIRDLVKEIEGICKEGFDEDERYI